MQHNDRVQRRWLTLTHLFSFLLHLHRTWLENICSSLQPWAKNNFVSALELRRKGLSSIHSCTYTRVLALPFAVEPFLQNRITKNNSTVRWGQLEGNEKKEIENYYRSILIEGECNLMFICAQLGRHTCVCLKGTALTEFSVSDTIAASGAGRQASACGHVCQKSASPLRCGLAPSHSSNDCFLARA